MGKMNDLAIQRSEALDAAVDRFLSWKLPKTFSPDAGISFNPTLEQQRDDLQWPIGTNLLTATEAKAMFQHCLSASEQYDAGYRQCVADFLAGRVYDVDKECAMPLPDIPLVLELRRVTASTPEGIKGWKDIRAGAEVMLESIHTIVDRHQGKIIPDDPT